MSEAIVKLTLYDVTLSMKYQTLKHVKTEFRAKFIAGPGGISNPLKVVKKNQKLLLKPFSVLLSKLKIRRSESCSLNLIPK